MKKNIFRKFLMLMLMIYISNTVAQNKYGAIIGIGNSGYSNGFIKSTYLSQKLDKSLRISHFGCLEEFPLNDKIKFRPKIMLSIQGGELLRINYFENHINERTITNYKLTYFSIPMNFKFFSKPYIIAGPQIALLVSTKKTKIDIGNIKSVFDYGVDLGIGYDFRKSFIEFNIYQGAQTLIDTNFMKATNLNFQLSYGYYFNL